jgi:hypothetical protein
MGGMLYYQKGHSWLLAPRVRSVPKSWTESHGKDIEAIGYKYRSGYGKGASGGRAGVPSSAEELLTWAKGVNPFMPELLRITGETPTQEPAPSTDTPSTPTPTAGNVNGGTMNPTEQWLSGDISLTELQELVAGGYTGNGNGNGGESGGSGALGLLLVLAMAML